MKFKYIKQDKSYEICIYDKKPLSYLIWLTDLSLTKLRQNWDSIILEQRLTARVVINDLHSTR